MRNAFLLILLSGFLIAFTQEKSRQETPLKSLKGSFKYTDLKTFEIDTFSWENRPNHYKALDSVAFKLIWQNEQRNFDSEGYNQDFFYSWQNRSAEFIELIILSQEESGYCSLLQYCIFDKNGKAIDNFIVAAQCGDGGWTYQSTGKLISGNTFKVISTETEVESIDPKTNKETQKGVIIVTHFIIGKDGKVTKKEISKTPIRKKV